ncbi:MAG: NTP transferase domain-containing protein [Prevotella sp.]|nr:NTP transferase domain-containing protein [Prevotella sp.]
MKYAIIAAGQGSRLADEGVSVPKPLVNVGGECLIDRLIRIFMAQEATEICVICNEQMPQVAEQLRQMQLSMVNCQLSILQKSTPSSMHSLYELSPLLGSEPFVLTTVDTIFREDEFADYVAKFQQMLDSGEADGLMAVTDYIDDECPLYVKIDEENQHISAFLDSDPQSRYVSGGIYALTTRSLDTLRQCVARGDSRMRNFQRALIADGLRLKAYPFTKILDIDHAADIDKANRFLL